MWGFIWGMSCLSFRSGWVWVWETKTESAYWNREIKKKWGRERSGVGGLSQLLFCCASSDSGLGCTPSSLGKRFKTQLPSMPFYEKRRWKYAKQHLFWISTKISYFILVLVEFFCLNILHNLRMCKYFRYIRINSTFILL